MRLKNSESCEGMGIPINLEGKNVLVTGGAGFGVGAGVCQAIAESGARLVVNDLDGVAAAKTAARYPGTLAIAGDIGKSEDVERIFAEAKVHCGVLHGVVNNAGVGLNKPAHEATEADFDRLFGIDVRGLWLVSKVFTNQLLETKEVGHIVNIASVHAHSTNAGYALYAAAKSAVTGLTRGMALDLGQHLIRVNAIAPGYVHSEQGFEIIRTWADDPQAWADTCRTDQQALPYFLDAVDCGYTAVFLLSNLSRGITGQTIFVDNGTTSMVFNRSFTERS